MSLARLDLVMSIMVPAARHDENAQDTVSRDLNSIYLTADRSNQSVSLSLESCISSCIYGAVSPLYQETSFLESDRSCR